MMKVDLFSEQSTKMILEICWAHSTCDTWYLIRKLVTDPTHILWIEVVFKVIVVHRSKGIFVSHSIICLRKSLWILNRSICLLLVKMCFLCLLQDTVYDIILFLIKLIVVTYHSILDCFDNNLPCSVNSRGVVDSIIFFYSWKKCFSNHRIMFFLHTFRNMVFAKLFKYR